MSLFATPSKHALVSLSSSSAPTSRNAGNCSSFSSTMSSKGFERPPSASSSCDADPDAEKMGTSSSSNIISTSPDQERPPCEGASSLSGASGDQGQGELRSKELYRVGAMMYFLVFCMYAHWVRLLTLYFIAIGCTAAQIGALVACGKLTTMFTSPFGCWIADRLRCARTVLVFSIFASQAMFFLLPFAGQSFYYTSRGEDSTASTRTTSSSTIATTSTSTSSSSSASTFFHLLPVVAVFLAFNLVRSPQNSLMDALTLALGGNDNGFWSKSRMWGAIGWGIMHVILGVLLDAAGAANTNYTATSRSSSTTPRSGNAQVGSGNRMLMASHAGTAEPSSPTAAASPPTASSASEDSTSKEILNRDRGETATAKKDQEVLVQENTSTSVARTGLHQSFSKNLDTTGTKGTPSSSIVAASTATASSSTTSNSNKATTSTSTDTVLTPASSSPAMSFLPIWVGYQFFALLTVRGLRKHYPDHASKDAAPVSWSLIREMLHTRRIFFFNLTACRNSPLPGLGKAECFSNTVWLVRFDNGHLRTTDFLVW
ncbi:unnamed protein product [Amoebophrya sp. A25]|nr:unnamed protein product [Amoebophrya sp. A25]|eukprot:GSA25T00025053001.1